MTHQFDPYGDLHRKYRRRAIWFAVKWIAGLVTITLGGLWVLARFGQ